MANKFAVIYVNFIARDFPHLWPTAFHDLFNLLSAEGHTPEQRMKALKFVLQVMKTMNQDLVERGETKSVYELDIATRVKDGVRDNSIEVIIQSLATSVLNNYT